VRQAPVSEPDTDDAEKALDSRRLHRVAEQRQSDFGLTHQYVRAVAKLPGVFHELSGGCPELLRPSAHFRREHRAAVEMGAKALGHVFKAPRAPIRVAGEGPPEQFVLPEPPGARHALRYGVVPAAVKEKGAFFAAEPLRQATVEVDDAITVDFDGIPGRDRLRAPWTRWLRCQLSAPSRHPTSER
jgi:hypothetical protein